MFWICSYNPVLFVIKIGKKYCHQNSKKYYLTVKIAKNILSHHIFGKSVTDRETFLYFIVCPRDATSDLYNEDSV